MNRPVPLDTPNAASPAASYAQGITAGPFVFTAGQVGKAPDGRLGETLAEQVDLALDNIAAILQTAGCTLSDVVKTTCFLADTSDFTEFDRLYRARFKDRLPARSTVGVAFSEPWILVEIEAVALSGAST